MYNLNIQCCKIEPELAISFIQKYHYSKILPRLTKHYLGMFTESKLCGVVTLGWGTQPLKTIQKLFPNYNFNTSHYLEIGKMCFLPEFNNSNYGSQALSVLIKWMKQNTECIFLYTLADGIMGKCGYVYQASNFTYIGSFVTSVYMDKTTGEKIHPRSAKKLCEENAKFSGKKKVFWLTDDFCKYKNIDKINGLMFRYIYPLNKYAKRILKKEYNKMDYPKDKDLKFTKRIANGRFMEIEQPVFNMNCFNYNFQKY